MHSARGPRAFVIGSLVLLGASHAAAREPSPADKAAETLAHDLALVATLEDQRSLGGNMLLHFAADARPEVKARALRALGRLQDEKARQVVVGALAAPEPEVRREAAFALSLTGPAEDD